MFPFESSSALSVANILFVSVAGGERRRRSNYLLHKTVFSSRSTIVLELPFQLFLLDAMLLVALLCLVSIPGSDGQINQIQLNIIPNSYFSPVSEDLIVLQQRMTMSHSAATGCMRLCLEVNNRCDIGVYNANDQMCRIYVNTGGVQQSSPGYTTFIRIDPPVVSPVILPSKESSLHQQKSCIECLIELVATSQWVPVGSMSMARISHTATLLSSGQVLVVGGHNDTGVHASCELFDPQSGTWTMTGPLVQRRHRHTATRLILHNTEVVFAIGGSSTTGFASVPLIEYYNVTSGVWKALVSPMIQGRFSHTTTLLMDGRLLSAAGQSTSSRLASAEIFDPRTSTSQLVGSLHVARYLHSASIIESTGNILAVGGTDSGGLDLRSCELFDVNTSIWSLVGNMSDARSFLAVAPLMPESSSILISGGKAGNSSVSSSQLYNPLTNSFVSAGYMSIDRNAHTSTLMYYHSTALVLIAGGSASTGSITNSTELYVVATSTWLNTASMNTLRNLHTATLLAGSPPSVLVTGGFTGASGSTRTAERLIFT